MPVDYSKFDHIEDSDEEPSNRASARSTHRGSAGVLQQSKTAPVAPPESRVLLDQSKRADTTAHTRPSLEPKGLDQLRIVGQGSSASNLVSELEQLGPRSPEAGAAREKGPQRVCVKSDGRKKIHTTFPDGAEMVEEFDERTDVLLLRKTRKPTLIGGSGEWNIEVGQMQETFDHHSDFLRVSTSNPVFLRKDTLEHFQWRIRNLLFPASVYSVTVDHEKQQIVVRTSNKKYFKRIDLPDLKRIDQKLEDKALTWKHQHNTLVISYQKPPEAVAEEQRSLRAAEQSALKL